MQEKSSNQKKLTYLQSIKCGISSLISSCISISSVHPLEVVKVRFQSHDGQANQHNVVPKYKGIFGALRQIIQDEGFQGLYKGLSITVINAALSNFLFFSLQIFLYQSYETRKKTLLLRKDSPSQNNSYEVLIASVQSGIGVICITQPMWVIRTRMLLNTNKNINQGSNIVFTVKQIKQQHGFKGFYKGFSMNLMLSSNRALQMLAYQWSQSLYDKLGVPQSFLMEKNFVCGSIAKIANVFIIYPFTTLRTRIIQNQYVKANPNEPKYNNVLEITLKTFKKQGISGFYKGMTANLLRGIPERGIFFYCYEMMKGVLLPQQKHD